MNAPHKPSTAAHEALVKSYVPDADGEELALRVQLARAHEHTTALLGNSVSEMAHGHVRDAHDLAGMLVFRHGLNPVQLKAAVDYCRHLCKASMLAEIFDGGGL